MKTDSLVFFWITLYIHVHVSPCRIRCFAWSLNMDIFKVVFRYILNSVIDGKRTGFAFYFFLF